MLKIFSIHLIEWTIFGSWLPFAHQALPAAAHNVFVPQLPPPPIHTLFPRSLASALHEMAEAKKVWHIPPITQAAKWRNSQLPMRKGPPCTQINATLAPIWTRYPMVARRYVIHPPYLECSICPFTLPKWMGQKRDLRRFTLRVIVLSRDKNLVYVLVRSFSSRPHRHRYL